MILSKTLHPDDYKNLTKYIPLYRELVGRVPAQINHKHRMWEYCMALSYLEIMKPKRILDIGGGGSLFAPMLALYGYEVTVMDSHHLSDSIYKQNILLGTNIKLVKKEFTLENFNCEADLGFFDAVTAISVIEHVEDDVQFLLDCMDIFPQSIFITTDFFKTGERFSPDHLRTYTPKRLHELTMIDMEWELYQEKSNWVDNGNHVNGYNFASMALCTI